MIAAVIMVVMMIIIMMAMVVMRVKAAGDSVILGNMIGPAFQIDSRMDTGYTAAILPDKFQGPAFKPQFGEFCPQLGRINSQVHKSAQGHIP
jgi:hypothetical protein